MEEAMGILENCQKGSMVASSSWHPNLAGCPGRYECSVSVSSMISTSSWRSGLGGIRKEAKQSEMSIGFRCGLRRTGSWIAMVGELSVVR